MSSVILFSELTNDGKKVGNYLLSRAIGKGQFGQVFLASHITTGRVYAVKQINKDNINSNQLLIRLLQTEINIMHDIKHANILHLYEFLQTANNYYLVLDFCNQGSYYSYIKSRGIAQFGEAEAVNMLRQIANGFQELRKRKILHRDFKLDNLFFNDNTLVIGDFGFAKSGVEMATTILGSPITMAYEILTAGSQGVVYSSKADIWSIGVVYYEILFGVAPFKGLDVEELVKDIQAKTKSLPFPSQISKESQHLLRHLLKTNPDDRMSWLEFFNHPLFDTFPLSLKPNLHNISLVTNEKVQTPLQLNQEFQQNKINAKALDDVDFYDHDDLIKSADKTPLAATMVEETPLDEITKSKMNVQLVFKEISYRYNHERNRLLFITYSIRNMQKYVKEGEFTFAKPEIFAMSVYLLQMAVFICRNIIDNLEQKINVYCFEAQFFKIFISSPKYRSIVESFHEDMTKLAKYRDVLAKRLKKYKVDVKPDAVEKLSPDDLYNNALRSYQGLRKHCNNAELADGKKQHKYLAMLAAVKYSIENQTTFSYVKQISYADLRFNWDDFYEFQQKLSNQDLLQFV